MRGVGRMRTRQILKQLGSAGALVAGVGVIVWLLWAVGWPAIQANLSVIGAWFLVLVVINLFAQLAFMAGWWVVIEPPLRLSKFLSLFGMYLAGDSINYLIPSGNLAGAPVKAHLSRETLGLGHAVASITVHKHAELLAQWVLLVGGMGVCLTQVNLSLPVKLTATAILGGLGGGLLGMTWALRKGAFFPILHRLARWGPLFSRFKSYQPLTEECDARIRTFYSKQGRRFAASISWCLVGWCGGLLETYVILSLLSPTEGWVTAVAIETLAMTLNSLLSFVPGRVGSAEGVRVGVFVLLGLPAAQGVTYGIVRRGRELLWIVPGLVVLLKRHVGWLGQPGLSGSPSKGSLA